MNADLLQLGLPDRYQEHAGREELLAEAGIDATGIQTAVSGRWP
jgi:1-deoxy-D-xylulose-5-phosphate synthase